MGPAALSLVRSWARKNSFAFWMFSSGFLRKASFDALVLKQYTLPSGAVQLTEQSVLTIWPEARPMAQELSNSPLEVAGGVGVIADEGAGGSSAAIAGVKAAPRHKATAIAVARAIEATPRPETSYIIGLSIRVHRGRGCT